MSELWGDLLKAATALIGGGLIVYFLARLLINHGRALEKVNENSKKDKEYERMQKIHSANSSMSASQRLDWLRKKREK